MQRRRFIRQLVTGLACPLGFLNLPALAGTSSMDIQVPRKRLILVELAGANDGLNTLVPVRSDDYYRLRPSIGLRARDVIMISDEQGLHPSLAPLLPVWESGEMAWVQGLGYPAPNRSHFTSMALWETAGDGIVQSRDTGWITHAIEHRLGRTVQDPHGISLGGDMALFASETGRWISLASARNLDRGLLPAMPQGGMDHPALALVSKRLSTLDTTLARLESKLASAKAIEDFNAGEFGEQLREVSRLIAAGVDTPVFRVQLTGFDTHDNQLDRHARLLRTLATGLNRFTKELKSQAEWRNTVVMTYSEFGRRAAENGSGGTDHGTAAPHLVLGGDVQGGLFGRAPDLGRLVDGDPAFTMDYRALYQSVLVDALDADSALPHLAAFADPRLSGLMRKS